MAGFVQKERSPDKDTRVETAHWCNESELDPMPSAEYLKRIILPQRKRALSARITRIQRSELEKDDEVTRRERSVIASIEIKSHKHANIITFDDRNRPKGSLEISIIGGALKSQRNDLAINEFKNLKVGSAVNGRHRWNQTGDPIFPGRMRDNKQLRNQFMGEIGIRTNRSQRRQAEK